jgi:glycosyltransferase involved in cell wall biosynthesis
MRILFISHSSGLDGAEQCLLDLLKGLNRVRYEGLVLFPKDGHLRRIVNSIGWETLICNMPWWIARDRRSRWHFKKVFFGIWPRVMFLRKLMKEKHVDLVYTNTITCIDASISSKLEGIPHVWHIHEILRGHTSLKSYLPRFFMSVIVSLLSERVIVPSKAAKKEIEWRSLQRKIQVINNGVDLKRFYSNKSTDFSKDLRDELGIAKDAKIVALIGSFLEIKGQLDFIEAAKKVLNERQECLFLLVGSGNATATESIKKKAKEEGGEPFSRFTFAEAIW